MPKSHHRRDKQGGRARTIVPLSTRAKGQPGHRSGANQATGQGSLLSSTPGDIELCDSRRVAAGRNLQRASVLCDTIQESQRTARIILG